MFFDKGRLQPDLSGAPFVRGTKHERAGTEGGYSCPN